jgi:hypothetical protein
MPRGADSAEGGGQASRPLCVGDRESRADGQGGQLIDRIAASAPVRKLLAVEASWDARVPLAGYRPDHRAGGELAAIDAYRAAEAAADLEGRLDNRVARQAWRNRLEIGDFTGRAAAAGSVPPRSVSGKQRSSILCGTKRSGVHRNCLATGGKWWRR